MDVFAEGFRTLLAMIDNGIYSLINVVYNLLMEIAKTTIFSNDMLLNFSTRIYSFLGIFLIFKVSFSLLTYIVNPDQMADKENGGKKMIKNILLVLILIIITPKIFSTSMTLQQNILNESVIEKIIFGVSEDYNVSTAQSTGKMMAYNTFTVFYTQSYDDGNDYIEQNRYSMPSLISKTLYLKQDDEYIMNYIPIVSTIAGGFIAWILFMFCFDIATRSVKFGFLQLIAPIPIISYIDPKSGKNGIFAKWIKACLGTYASLFVRIAVIDFAILVITEFDGMRTNGQVTDNPFVMLFIIIGALIFAKQLPKLLEDIFGINLDSKFTLNPIKKVQDEALGGKALISTAKTATAMGLVGAASGASNFAAKIKNGDGIGGALLSAQGGLFGGASKALMGGIHNEKFGKNIANSYQKTMANRNNRDDLIDAGSTMSDRLIARGQTMFGMPTEAKKQDRAVEGYDKFIKIQDEIDKKAGGEVDKDASTRTTFTYTNTAGASITGTGNVAVLKSNIEVLKNNGATAVEIADAQSAYNAAYSNAKRDYIDSGANVQINSNMNSLNTIINDYSDISTFSTMGTISNSNDLKRNTNTVKDDKVILEKSDRYESAHATQKVVETKK
ncbi:MAG: hypothetical protein ACK5HP_04880 [Bacilli bacterium]